MKIKATKKEIINGTYKVLKIGYCQAQYLLQYEQPFAYSVGVYGWACDYYDIEGVIISTGYSPIGDGVNFKLLKEYEDKASRLIDDYNLEYELKKKEVEKLLKEFVKKCLEA